MPEPLVVTTLRQFRAALLAREYTQIAEMALHWRRMETNLEGLMMALAQDIAEQKAAGREITAGLLVRQERYKRLLAQVRDELKQYDDWLLPSIRERQMEYGSLGIQSAYEASRAAYDGYLAQIGIDFDRLPITAIENMIGYAGDGSPLNKLLKKYNAKAVDAMTNALIDAVAVGTNPRETAAKMADAFGIGLNDAMTLARTEQLRVYREAQREQYTTSGNFIGYRRMCAKDDRTCIACLVADGTIYSLDTPFPEHPNGRCLPAGVLAYGDAPMLSTQRLYSGELISIRTASGKQLSFTPDHPILTSRGWLLGKFIQEGDYVVSSTLSQDAAATIREDNYQTPAMIEQIAVSFRMILDPMPVTAVELNGNGKASQVNIVNTNRLLGDCLNIPFSEPFVHKNFSGGNIRRMQLPTYRYSFPLLNSMRTPLLHFMGSVQSGSFIFGTQLRGKQSVGFGLASSHNTGVVQTKGNHVTGDVEGLGNRGFRLSANISGNDFVNGQGGQSKAGRGHFLAFNETHGSPVAEQPASLEFIREAIVGTVKSSGSGLHTLASNICLDRILEVNRTTFTGHVYNLQTRAGWYIANGIITHNCTLVPIPRDVPEYQWQTGKDWFMQQTAATQESIMGKGAYAAWKDGAFGLDDMVKRHVDETWGASLIQKPLKELIPDGMQ